MSRTKRNYGHHYPKISNWEKTQVGCDPNYYVHYDPRDKGIHGYDGISLTYYYTGYPSYGFKENYQGTSRKSAKRRWHKQRRMQTKISIREIEAEA